jgi:hypothetical protein
VHLLDYIGLPIILGEIKSWLKFIEKRILFISFNVVLL